MREYKYIIGQDVYFTHVAGVRKRNPLVEGRGTIVERYGPVLKPYMVIPDWDGPSGGNFYVVQFNVIMKERRGRETSVPGICYAAEEELVGVCPKHNNA